MYAMVRDGGGLFYTSTVFAFYRAENIANYSERYWVLLNREKTALIKQPALEPDVPYLIPKVLIVDADETGWVDLSDRESAMDFLPGKELLSMIDNGTVPEELTRRCIEMDRTRVYEPVRTIEKAEDIRDLMWASGGFHDGGVSELRQEGDRLHLTIDGIWGCRIEMEFEGEVAYNTAGITPERYRHSVWFGGTVAMEDGFVYLIDDTDVAVKDLNPEYGWFRGRKARYKILPD